MLQRLQRLQLLLRKGKQIIKNACKNSFYSLLHGISVKFYLLYISSGILFYSHNLNRRQKKQATLDNKMLTILQKNTMFPYTDLMNYIFSNLWLSGLQGTSRDPYKCFKTIRDFLNKLHRSGGLCSYCGILHKYKGQVTDKVRYKSQLLVSKATLVYKVVFSSFLTV